MSKKVASIAFCFMMLFASQVLNLCAQQIVWAPDIFRKYMEYQQVYQDACFLLRGDHLDNQYLKAFQENYENYRPQLKGLTPFLHKITNGQINDDGHLFAEQLDDKVKACFCDLYYCFDKDFIKLIECLREYGFATHDLNNNECQAPVQGVAEKYRALARLIFSHQSKSLEDEGLFSLAGRLFEHCFGQQNSEIYQDLLKRELDFPIARLVASVMWYHLEKEGWKHWHAECLKNLKKEADAGKKIVYIAGGADVIQLLKMKIHSLEIIDPFLPTQTNYYSEGWEYLVDGSIGDLIRFGHDYDFITLERVDRVVFGKVQARFPSGIVQDIPKVTTTWRILDKENKAVGSMIFHRRHLEQQDLVPSDEKVLLIGSGDALQLVAPAFLSGWGIDLAPVDESLKIFVKQLKEPIDKRFLDNMLIATLLDFSNLGFINAKVSLS